MEVETLSDTAGAAEGGNIAAPVPAADNAAKLKLSLEPQATVATTALEALRFGHDALERNRGDSAKGESEPIHQLRVSARRLRASLQLFSGIIRADYSNVVERDLTWMAQAAGGAREREITAEVIRSRAHKIDPTLAHSLDHLYATLERERLAHLTELAKVLQSKRYRTLLTRLEQPRLRKTDTDGVLAGRAASMLRPIVRSVSRAGAELDEHSPTRTIHRLRVRVKRLRYAVEMLSTLGTKRSRKLLARLEQLQDLLGALNDVAVAIGWLMAFSKSEGNSTDTLMAAGAMVQSLRERSAKLSRRCAKAWRKLDKSSSISDAIDDIRRKAKHLPGTQVSTEDTTTVDAA